MVISNLKKTEDKRRISICFRRKDFVISIFNNKQIPDKDLFSDIYHNYLSTLDIYDQILFICQNIDIILEDTFLFDKLDAYIKEYQRQTKFNQEKWALYLEIYSYIVNLENQGKITREENKKPISYLQQILENDGPEYAYIIDFWPIWDKLRKYRIAVCVRGVPIVKKL